MEPADLTFALVPGRQRRSVSHRGGGEVSGGAVHLVGEGAVGQPLLLVPLADETRQRELVMRGQAGGVAEALRPGGPVLFNGTRLHQDTQRGHEKVRKKHSFRPFLPLILFQVVSLCM